MNVPVYSGSQTLLKELVRKFGLEVTWVPAGCSIEEFRRSVKANTKVGYMNTINNTSDTVSVKCLLALFLF